MRLGFCNHFKISEQTFFNKTAQTRLPSSYFSKQQVDWLENWAKENGMPDDYQPEGSIGQIPTTENS